MRVLFASTGNLGHFLPQVPLARALTEAGHDVRVAVPAGFVDQVAAVGLTVAPFGEPPPDVIGRALADLAGLSLEDSNERVVRDVFGHLDAGAALPGLLDTVRSWHPHLMMRDPVELASLAAAGAEGVAHAVTAIGIDAFVGKVMSWLADPLDALGDRVGLDGPALLDAMRDAPTFTTLPPTFDDAAHPARHVVHRYRGRSAVGAAVQNLPTWADPAAPLVYASLGSTAATMPGTDRLFAAILAALAPLDVRVLLTVGHGADPETLRPWPDNAHVVRWWDQSQIMPHAGAVVGHGGFGTTTTALAAGVPQVAVPLFALDQWANARRLDEIGAGVLVTTGDGFEDRLAAGVRRVLDDDEIRATAHRLAEEMAALPAASAMVGRLEELAGPG